MSPQVDKAYESIHRTSEGTVSERSGPGRSGIERLIYSPEERRLRAGWRLAVHSILTFLLSLPFTVLLALVIVMLRVLGQEQLLQGFTPALAIIAVPAVVLSTWIARRFIDRRSFQSLGFQVDRRTLLDLGVGFAIPGLLFGLIFVFDSSMGWLRLEAWRWQSDGVLATLAFLGLGLFVFIAVGFYEELLYRGYYLVNLQEGLNLGWAVALTSAAFAAGHLLNPSASLTSTGGLLAAGLYLAYARIRSGSLWLPIGLHIGWNFFEGTIFGYPVSGLNAQGLLLQRVEGPEWLTGGAFGPEAGGILLPVLAIGAGLVFLYTQGRHSPNV